MFHAQELGSYAQGQGSLAVFKVTARDQGHYKGPSGAFVTYCNISCSKFYRRNCEFKVGLKSVLQHFLSEPEFFGGLVYKIKRIFLICLQKLSYVTNVLAIIYKCNATICTCMCSC